MLCDAVVCDVEVGVNKVKMSKARKAVAVETLSDARLGAAQRARLHL
jgi:hypothetical protein